MKMYYQDKLKAIVESRYEQASRDVKCGLIETLPPLVKFRNDVVRELFAAEPDQVREEVAQYAIKRKQGGDLDLANSDEGDQKINDTAIAQAEAYLK